MSAIVVGLERAERIVVVCGLADVHDLSETGHKADNLGQMLRMNVNVPPGFVVTAAAFRQFLSVNSLAAPIAEILTKGPEDFRAAAAAVQALVRSCRVPDSILECVVEMRLSLLPAGRLIVRSSAVGEDGSAASFAGQLDSISDIETPEQIERALIECWSSYWNERALFYQHARGVRLRGMGVIVQSQVNSRLSGVLFTHAPDAAAGNQLYGEYCEGRGEALVSGQVTPERFRISRPDLRCVAEGSDKLHELLSLQIEKLGTIGVALEQFFGAPQDIEWTIDDSGQLFLLQSRPITASARSRPEVLWSNANVNENFPNAISPFLYSVAREGYYHYFRNLAIAFGLSHTRIRRMEAALRHIIGVHHSRMYYNLTSIHSVLRQAPFGETLADFFNQFVGATRLAATSEAQGQPRWRQAGELFMIAFKTLRQYLFFRRRIEAFERVVDRFAAATRPKDLQSRCLTPLRDDLRGFMEIRCHRWTNASLADAAAMISYGVLQFLLRTAYPEASQSAIHNNLLKGLTSVVSVQPTIRLWEISRRILLDPELARRFAATESTRIPTEILNEPQWDWLRQDIEGYLEAWGFRFSGELMLTVASLQEDPAPLFDMLRTYLLAEGPSPVEAITKLEADRLTETVRVFNDLRRTKRFPWTPRRLQAPLLHAVLRCAHRAIEMRERVRLKQALLYSRCRRIVLAIGSRLIGDRVLEAADDAFFLTHAELDDLISGHEMFPVDVAALIALRKQAQAAARTAVVPDTFSLLEGEYFSNTTPSNIPKEELDSELRGIGACGGSITAQATVLESVAEARKLRQGDILVTRQTDPGWGPVFFLIRGLVIERGGMLSHGAIIAREFGLPCVVGVKDATQRIPQQCLLSVDGDRGHVRILA